MKCFEKFCTVDETINKATCLLWPFILVALFSDIPMTVSGQRIVGNAGWENAYAGARVLDMPGHIKADSLNPEPPYINTAFENASPLEWSIASDGAVILDLVYDHERSSQNKSISHWHFQVEAKQGSEITFIIKDYINIYNGRRARVFSKRTRYFVSEDGLEWASFPCVALNGDSLMFKVYMKSKRLFIAGLPPYRVSDLERFLAEIQKNRLIKIDAIGKTVEGRQLEIITLGNTDAPYRIFLRARAHAFEAGGNWLLEGLINNLIQNNSDTRRYLKKYCLYILPMANKDGVARGKSRFNGMGMDLNRKWNMPADPDYAPENHALEIWLETMIRKGLKPHLLLDLHNDPSGGIHISRPPHVDLEQYLSNMENFEFLLRKLTWFTEGSTGVNFRDGVGSIAEGLMERYGIEGCVFELNDEWIAGLNKPPLPEDWKLMGRQLCEVFFQYFDGEK
jgi:hypothetical protein